MKPQPKGRKKPSWKRKKKNHFENRNNTIQNWMIKFCLYLTKVDCYLRILERIWPKLCLLTALQNLDKLDLYYWLCFKPKLEYDCWISRYSVTVQSEENWLKLPNFIFLICKMKIQNPNCRVMLRIKWDNSNDLA